MNDYLAVKALWLSVILQAISDYYSAETRNFHDSDRYSAIKWLFDVDTKWNSFIAVSGYFDIDYKSIRRTLGQCKSMRQFRDVMQNIESDELREERILNKGFIFELGSHVKDMPAVFNPMAEE